jgi:hypothetical protein
LTASSGQLFNSHLPVNRLRPLESLYEDFGSDLSMVMNLSPILKEQEHD